VERLCFYSRARLWRADGGRDSGDTWRRSRGIGVGFWSGREVVHGLASLISNQRWLEVVRWWQSSCGPWRRHAVRERGRARARLADWSGERTRVAGVEPWRARWLRGQGESSHDEFMTLPPLPLHSGRTEDKKDDSRGPFVSERESERRDVFWHLAKGDAGRGNHGLARPAHRAVSTCAHEATACSRPG
jgi:hypothetical protein